MLRIPAAPSQIPSSGICALALSPLPDRNGRKLVDDWGGTTRGSFPTDCAPAECGSRQTHPPKMKPCRERPMCRSASVKRYLLTHDIKALHECRDSACRRPFGVRRNAAGVCSEMTPVGFYTCLPLLVCRDPACRRPFGVRLRGNVWLQRSPLHGDVAPLRMTQWVWRIVGCNIFVIMLL